jgi:amino acid adenylation domain-containing protein
MFSIQPLDERADDFLKKSTIFGLIEQQVQRSPHSIAVSCANQKLSYLELNQKANQLAFYLQSLGARNEMRVGIFVSRSCEMIVGLLGILKSGGAYVPLDPIYPQERLAHMIQDANLSLIITQKDLLKSLPAHSSHCVCIDSDWNKISNHSIENPSTNTDGDNTAYVIYTSGSTGQSKGVQLLHRGVVNFLISMQKRPGITSTDKVLAVTTLCFDIAALECFLPLTVGAEVIMVGREKISDGLEMLDMINQHHPTLLQATPATWRMLLEAGWQKTPGLKILCGGELLSSELATELLKRGESVWNLYGPTETTIWSTVHRLTSAKKPISIGHPIANTQIYILDENLRPVLKDETGELYIGGEGLARGYLNRPELTAERFIKNPFNPESRIYKTGDVARWLPGGDIEILGRLDHQVKVRGYRIELGEIESVLCQFPGIKESVVIAEDTPLDEKRLICYLKKNSDTTPSENELRSFLNSKLPEYMIPSSFGFLEKMPLTPNGKVDRKALPPIERCLSSNKHIEPAHNSTEEKLIQIWSEILGVHEIGIHDDFFHLGGNSLLAVRLVNQIKKIFGRKPPLTYFFQSPTINSISRFLKSPQRISNRCLVKMQTDGHHPPFYCVTGASDTVLRFRDLVTLFGKDYPFYGLQNQEIDGNSINETTVELLATKYLNEIRDLQSTGPYYLGGYCFGAIVAFEMARQLTSQGEKVNLLAMLEPATDSLNTTTRSVFIQHLERYLYHGKVFWQLSIKEKWGYLGERTQNIWKRTSSKILNDERARIGIEAVNMAQNYTPSPLPCRITLFLGNDTFMSQGSYTDPRLDWGLFAAGELEIYRIPGNHVNILQQPFVEKLSDYLKTCIRRTSIPVVKESSSPKPEPASVLS